MESSSANLLTTLVIFENTINPELIRTLHVYQLKDGKEKEVEREFFFSRRGTYVEMGASPILRLQNFRPPEVVEGYVNGVWLCLFAFDISHKPQLSSIPPLLLPSRNTKLKTIPTLARDLQTVFELSCGPEEKNVPQNSPYGMCREDSNSHQSRRTAVLENEHYEESLPGVVENKTKRTATGHISSITLSDLVKYFDMPIIEASRKLKVGLTVLKRKCREFGIPRWPHRKIKSLDSLIHEVQEEAQHQQQENKAAAMAVASRQRILESEKETIERKPFMEIQSETKRFRQDVFKRRHRARAHEKQGSSVSSS
ncbi:RWP-RK domain containing protein [Quillaja saponaria]|uniref:RWP-RK domain containing protein n=1 Tax=Quillaja saponaria TaxID=32244 RepID=A0AAD7KQV8_QUISA|nr:RWP-RK domain containing protein [Quillaja saponaria]